MASRSGNTAVMASLLAVPLIGMGGLALDYTYLHQTASKLQGSADAAALTTAKEMTLANADIHALKSIAEAYVMSNLGDVASPETTQVDVLPAQGGTEVKVTVSHVWKPMLLHYFVDEALPIVESSIARLAGERSLCMLGLDGSMEKSIYLRKSASLEAPGCAVFSNSSDRKAIVAENNAVLEAGLICAVGGFVGQKQASFEPKPVTDCPSVDDPLINRSTPPVGLCDHTKFEINTGTHMLYPGTYCDGLKIKGSAKAYLKPGIYVVTGNKLEVTDNAVLDGKNVGFYLHGHKSKIEFKKQTTIRLTAPKSGLMAGILIFEDRSANNKLQKHRITSDNAGLLLGTIYLPNGTLRIDSSAPIADDSAYTAIIARTIELDEGPTLHLNSDYEATDVPLPEGLTNDRFYLAR